jgi:ABC-type spermidine/putrescine transport system permease subunit II
VERVVDTALEIVSGPACAVLGAAGFLAGPLLMAGTTSRYLVLFADLGALALGLYAAYAAYRGRTRWDTIVFGVSLAAISMTLWIMASRSGVVPGGGT